MSARKVVIIENNPATAEDIANIFTEKECNVLYAKNGLDGIELICQETPDLVVLNPSVTDITGSCVYKLIKDNPKTSDIPVLIFVENERDMFRFWGMKPQIEQNLVKFTTRENLAENIDKAIKLIEGRGVLSKFQIQSEQFKDVLGKIVEIYQSGQGLASENAKGALHELLDKVTTMLNSEVGSLMLLEEGPQELVIKAAKGLSEDLVGKTRIKMGRGISGWVARAGNPLLVRDIERDERFSRENNRKYYTSSLLSAPIRIKEKVVGVINVNNKSSREPFTEYDLSILTILTNEISIAIESSDWQRRLEEANSRIDSLKSSKRILADVARSLDDELYELTISQEVSNIIYSRLDYKEIIDAILEIIERSIDCHLCGLLFVDEERRTEIIVEIKYPTSQQEIDSFKLKMVETFNRLTGEKLLPEQVTIREADGHDTNIVNTFAETRDILSSCQANLLMSSDRPIGMLAVTNSFPNAFTNEDLRIFSIISRHSSIAINNTLLHKKIKELSITDGLTGLYVYRYFNDMLDKEILRSARYQQPFSLIMLDLDGFKEVNDNFGHLQGDTVLREVAQILKRVCREVDIVARYGGEEFTVILPATDMEGAYILADRIRMVIKNYAFGTKDNIISLTASMGVASYPESASTKIDLIKQVDRALYKVKADGRNGVCRALKET
ncbi:MAG: diguanylate cyclase [Candidatus Omnitrophota bacterium]|nr:diguanylate cyclase [Candidatus Omnitrophota bacterium]